MLLLLNLGPVVDTLPGVPSLGLTTLDVGLLCPGGVGAMPTLVLEASGVMRSTASRM
jgi:hypothetical protein